MKKSDFNRLLRRITAKKRIDLRKIKDLTFEERSNMVQHIVRHRMPIIDPLIPDNFDDSWLNSMGYLSKHEGKLYNWRCTQEHEIVQPYLLT